MTDGGADICYCCLDEGRGIPRRTASANVHDEVPEQGRSVGAVMHLGMELHTPYPTVAIADGADLCILRMTDPLEARRNGRQMVTMTHPHLRCGRHTGKEVCRIVHTQRRPAELTTRCLIDSAAKLEGYQLQSVADAKDGYAQTEHVERRDRRTIGIDARRSTGQDDTLRRQRLHGLCRDVKGMDLGIHAGFTHLAGDDLRVLRTEVEDDNALCVRHECVLVRENAL